MPAAFATGLGLGLAVAAQVGPISLLLIRSVLRGALLSGIAIGAGAALVDMLYAALGVAGAAALLEIDAVALAFGVLGAAVLALIGVRTLWSAFRVRAGGEADEEVERPRRAFATSVAATASNPLTIASWGAVFAAATTADVTGTPPTTLALLLGVGVGTLTWFTGLALVLAATRHRVGPRFVRTVDAAAGLGLLGFAALLGWRTVQD